MERMMREEPSERPSLEEVLKHPWMMQDMPPKDRIKEEFAGRQTTVA